MEIFLGLDIGGTTVKAALVTETGDILHKHEFATNSSAGMEDFCTRTKDALYHGLQQANLDMTAVRGIGVGIPGPVDLASGTVIEAVNLGWVNVPVVRFLQDALGLPVALENDANVAALGEAWRGAGSGSSSALCVVVGTGVGGGIVLDGHLYRGAQGGAGEIGHLLVQKGGPRCNCGNQGCLETLASATGIIRFAKEAQARGELQADTEIRGAEDVFRLATMGDVGAQRVVSEAADWLGYGLSLASDTLNPEVIVIGGGVSKAKDLLLQPVREAFRRYVFPVIANQTRIELALLGNDAGAIGSARLIAQQLGA